MTMPAVVATQAVAEATATPISPSRLANVGMAAMSPTEPLVRWEFSIREPEDDEVVIRVMYCGICHSDIHTVRGEWTMPRYPIIPGHEFVGFIEKVGPKVTKFQHGDRCGVGCLVAACDKCEYCRDNVQQFCADSIPTYGADFNGDMTQGGYAKFAVARASYVLKLSDKLNMSAAAPLLCAGITTYSPMKNNHMDRGNLKIGVIGLGGLGHMALQWGVKLNPTNEVMVISRSEKKLQSARALGAKGMIVATDQTQMEKYHGYFDYLIDTVSSPKDLTACTALLKPRGSLISVGLPGNGFELTLDLDKLGLEGKSIQGSLIGGIAQTQEMLDFAAEKGVIPVVENITADKVNEAYTRILNSDIQYRFVIDVYRSY